MANKKTGCSCGNKVTNIVLILICGLLAGIFVALIAIAVGVSDIKKTCRGIEDNTYYASLNQVPDQTDSAQETVSEAISEDRPAYSGSFASELAEYGIIPVETASRDEFQDMYGASGQSFSVYIGELNTFSDVPTLKLGDNDYSYNTDFSELLPDAAITSDGNSSSAIKTDESGDYVYYLQNFAGDNGSGGYDGHVYAYCRDRLGAEEINMSVGDLSYRSNVLNVLSAYGVPTRVDVYEYEGKESVVLDYVADNYDVTIIVSNDVDGEYISEVSISRALSDEEAAPYVEIENSQETENEAENDAEEDQ